MTTRRIEADFIPLADLAIITNASVRNWANRYLDKYIAARDNWDPSKGPWVNYLRRYLSFANKDTLAQDTGYRWRDGKRDLSLSKADENTIASGTGAPAPVTYLTEDEFWLLMVRQRKEMTWPDIATELGMKRPDAYQMWKAAHAKARAVWEAKPRRVFRDAVNAHVPKYPAETFKRSEYERLTEQQKPRLRFAPGGTRYTQAQRAMLCGTGGPAPVSSSPYLKAFEPERTPAQLQRFTNLAGQVWKPKEFLCPVCFLLSWRRVCGCDAA